MKTLTEQIADKCIHFNGMMNSACKKGILYDDVKIKSESPYKIPCMLNTGMSGGTCASCEFPSAEDVAKEVAEIESMGGDSVKAMILVKDHYKKTRQMFGNLVCPACNGNLSYAIVEYNGHARILCKDCKLSVIE